jgi:MFS family permease
MGVALVPVQTEFGVSRADATVPYTMAMLGFGAGSIVMGRLADRAGAFWPAIVSAVFSGGCLIAAGMSGSLLQYTVALALAGFFGIAAVFAPLIADTALWFTRGRGIAVAICASGNYVAGTLWPPALTWFFERYGWRATFVGAGIFCMALMIPLAFVLRRRITVHLERTSAVESMPAAPFGFTPRTLQLLLCGAGFACCAAMAIPQFHIVALCSDLGYAAARGAEMLALVLGFGIVSRLGSGWLCDRIGVLRLLVLGSALQALSLVFYLPAQSLAALYAASIFFGIVQGGIVPAYAIIVRENFPVAEAGWRTGAVMMSTQLGMAGGAWMSAALFDFTGSYTVPFWNGIAWNVANLAIALLLLRRHYFLRSPVALSSSA